MLLLHIQDLTTVSLRKDPFLSYFMHIVCIFITYKATYANVAIQCYLCLPFLIPFTFLGVADSLIDFGGEILSAGP